jgi:hypothetical protein
MYNDQIVFYRFFSRNHQQHPRLQTANLASEKRLPSWSAVVLYRFFTMQPSATPQITDCQPHPKKTLAVGLRPPPLDFV